MKKQLLLLSSFFLFISLSKANNIEVKNASLTNQNTTTHTTIINFDVNWENSWRTSTNENNYDGAWIFVKYRKNGTTDWRHATIKSTGNTSATGAVFSVPSDNKGAFIYRSSNGIGNVNFTGNKLTWDYSVDGLLDNETVEIRVFALEMIYIPTGSFQLGSGGTEISCFKDGISDAPYLVANANAITTGTTSGNLNFNGMGTGTSIPATFPTGYNAFWIMKYECTQQQYADFLNHLDEAKANLLNIAIPGTFPNFTPSAPYWPIAGAGFRTNAALADWSALRPFSELEFEKACRGYNTPAVANEYVWGNTTLIPLTAVNDQLLSTESVSTPADANASITNYLSPSRAGIFARPSGSTRTLSGATYYGVLNMGDNVEEIVIYSGSVAGKLVTATKHGDGYLAADGLTNITEWQTSSAFGTKGGSTVRPAVFARTSDRINVSFFTSYPADFRQPSYGMRLVRTAP